MSDIHGHNMKREPHEPSPKCQYPACHRRAEYLYIDKATGMKVYRPWCAVHRPVHGQRYGNVTALPKAYPRDHVTWPDEIRCPFCTRKREPRMRGQLRPTCRVHRGQTPDGPVRGPGRPRIHPPRPLRAMPPLRTTPRHVRRAPPPPPRPTPGSVWKAFPYKDNGRAKTMAIPKKDRELLRALWIADEGHYASATDHRLTRKYPTSLISALWNYWYEQEGT